MNQNQSVKQSTKTGQDHVAMLLKMPQCGTMLLVLHQSRGRPGFDVGYKAARGIPRTSHLVNPTGNAIVANDDNYALAA